MKKMFFISLVLLSFIYKTKAQETSFGVTAGYNNLILKISVDGENASLSETGYFFGFFSEFVVGESISIQPQINYASAKFEDENFNQLIFPIMFKYYAADQLYFQVGPQFDYVLNDELADESKRLGVSISFGIGYDIVKNTFIFARYGLGLNNRVKLEDSSLGNLEDSFKIFFNSFQAGIGYRF